MQKVIIDPDFQKLIPALRSEELEGLKSSILKEGCRDSLIIWKGYSILVDGHNRHEICTKNSVPFSTVEMEFESREHVKLWILENQLSRRNLTDGQRFDVALQKKEVLAQAGREKKVESGKEHHKGVPKVLSKNDNTFGSIKESPKHNTRQEIASDLGWSTGKVAQAEVVKKESPETWEKVKSGEATVGAAYTEVKKPHVANNSGENEWYTPPKFTEAARRVMGGIDLDPASNELANKFVGADAFYTKEDDGLTKPWRGRVWLNPPYAQPLISEFAAAVVEKHEKGEFEQAIVLVNNATDTKWLQSMMRVCDAMCFLEGRVRYLDKTGDPKNSPIQGQVVLYFGNATSFFFEEFSSFGVVVRR